MKQLLFFSFFICALNLYGQVLDICISNVRNFQGQLCVAIFADKKGYEAQKPVQLTNYDKSRVENGEFRVRISLKPGIYALSVLDDENENKEMDYTLLGMPREGFGFSGYTFNGFKKPRFDDFSFRIKEDELKKIQVVMRYLK
ncbi:MAG: DUF2141 domain-containing protein [Prevotellaceae bacterium]|jgi:uncharacterized protein (DUF2141 family)|nr:DUF2141 domain-containing protein [Prevotellaceae bacterium]